MKIKNKKLLQVLPDGSLAFNFSNLLKPKQTIFFKKSSQNFNLKKLNSNFESKDFINSKNKYLN
jgi:hypothetical protein